MGKDCMIHCCRRSCCTHQGEALYAFAVAVGPGFMGFYSITITASYHGEHFYFIMGFYFIPGIHVAHAGCKQWSATSSMIRQYREEKAREKADAEAGEKAEAGMADQNTDMTEPNEKGPAGPSDIGMADQNTDMTEPNKNQVEPKSAEDEQRDFEAAFCCACPNRFALATIILCPTFSTAHLYAHVMRLSSTAWKRIAAGYLIFILALLSAIVLAYPWLHSPEHPCPVGNRWIVHEGTWRESSFETTHYWCAHHRYNTWPSNVQAKSRQMRADSCSAACHLAVASLPFLQVINTILMCASVLMLCFTRGKYRATNGIKGNPCLDFFSSLCCGGCVQCQLMSEMKVSKEYRWYKYPLVANSPADARVLV